MFETPIIRHQPVQDLLPGVTERGVSQVMGQRQGFDQVFVQPQPPGDAAGDLGHLQGMGQAGSVIISLMVDENLGLVLQPAEGGTVDDPVPVPLESRAGILEQFLVTAAPAFGAAGGIGGRDRDVPCI